jgi:flagellar basal-body rod modification protein FlgD
MIEATSSAVLAGLSGESSSEAPNNNADNLGMDTFLQLMTTQLRYQDPSAPQDSSQFLDQMAQFSSLSGIQSMEQSITRAVEGLQSNRLLQASSMVGKQVLVQTDQLSSAQPPSAISGEISLSSSTAHLSVRIQNEAGQTVRTMALGALPGGRHSFTWDGLDQNGNALPAGSYRLIGDVAEPNDALPQVSLRDQVVSVTVDPSGELYMNLRQVPAVSLAQVGEVS